MRALLHTSNDAERERRMQRLGDPLALLPEELLNRVLAEGSVEHGGEGAVRAACPALRCAFDACNTTLTLHGREVDDVGVRRVILNGRRVRDLHIPLRFPRATLALQCAAANLPGLHTLHLGMHGMHGMHGADDVATMASTLERFTALQSLSLHGLRGDNDSSWYVETMRAIAPAVRAMPNLRKFIFRMEGYVETRALTDLLLEVPLQLEELGLLDVLIAPVEPLERALLRLPALRSVAMHVLWLIDLTNLPAVLSQLAHLASVEVVLLDYFQEVDLGDVQYDVQWSPARLLHGLARPATPHQLTRVELAGGPLTDDVADLSDALRSLPGLSVVSLSHMRMGPEAVAALAPALAALTRVTRLHLDGNAMGAAGAAALAPALRALPGLRDLALSMNGIGAGGAAALAPALRAGSIERLAVCFNGLGDEGLAELDPSTMGRLRTLDLRCNGLSAAGLTAAVELLALRSKGHLAQVLASPPRDPAFESASLLDLLPCLELPPRADEPQDIYMQCLRHRWGAVDAE